MTYILEDFKNIFKKDDYKLIDFESKTETVNDLDFLTITLRCVNVKPLIKNIDNMLFQDD